LLVAALVLAVFAATVSAALFYSGSSRILNTTGVKLLDSAEKRAAKEVENASLALSPSPLTSWLAAALLDGDEPEAGPVVRTLDALALGLLGTLVYLFASFLAGPFAALLAPLLLLLQPQIFQRLMENGAGIAMTLLLAPALVLGVALTRQNALARIILCAMAGLLGGLAMFTHHLGLWTTIAATMAIFPAARPLIPKGHSLLAKGHVELAPLGLELAAILLFFLIAALGFYKISFMEGKEVLSYLFGPFKSFHPPFAVAGTIYREVVDGGPPWWTTCYLWLLRTPLSLWLLSGIGLAASLQGRVRLSSMLWLPLGPILAILVVTAGAGSPLYTGSLNLLAPLGLISALLATAAVRSGESRGGPFWVQHLPAGLAVLVVAHLVIVDARHLPHPSAYANLLGGGSGGALAGGNGLYVEPTIDESAAHELLALGRKVVVSPWDRGATPLLSRYAREWGMPAPKVRPGGALPALLHAGGSDHAGELLLDYCNGPDVAASLTIDNQMLWCVVDPGAAP